MATAIRMMSDAERAHPKGQQQADLFAPSSAQSDALMAVMDQIKAKVLGRVGFASQGTGSTE